MKTSLICASAFAVAITSVASATPVNISFARITGNSSQNPAGQFLCVMDEVTPGPGGSVSFRFTNAVGIASNIAEIYFQDGPLLGAATLTQTGTSFTPGPANPGNLPGANNATPPFVATELFSADVNPGPPANGINLSTDALVMTFNLINNASFQDCISAFNSGALRVGLHVRSIGGDGQSDSFVSTNGGTPEQHSIPLPAAASMGLASLMGLAAIRRRRTA